MLMVLYMYPGMENAPARRSLWDSGEGKLCWDDFFRRFARWGKEELAARIDGLEHFGDSDEVCEAICRMPTFQLENALYHRALKCGVRFRREELAQMGHLPEKPRGTAGKWFNAILDRLLYYRGGDDWEEWEVVWE